MYLSEKDSEPSWLQLVFNSVFVSAVTVLLVQEKAKLKWSFTLTIELLD
jgi:hypothetical protein